MRPVYEAVLAAFRAHDIALQPLLVEAGSQELDESIIRRGAQLEGDFAPPILRIDYLVNACMKILSSRQLVDDIAGLINDIVCRVPRHEYKVTGKVTYWGDGTMMCWDNVADTWSVVDEDWIVGEFSRLCPR